MTVTKDETIFPKTWVLRSKKLIKFLFLYTLVMLLGPFYIFVFGEYATGDEHAKNVAYIEQAQVGLAPLPLDFKEPVVQVYAARVWGHKGVFSVHTWIATKEFGEKDYTIAQIKGWLYQESNKKPLVVELGQPDVTWMGNRPTLLVDIRGSRAGAIIKKVRKLTNNYPFADSYNAWPGPNSNTFISYLGHNIPELGLDMPSNAIGKDYTTKWFHFQRFGSKSNIEMSLGKGLIGLKLGLNVGIEFYFLTLNAQFDLDDLTIDYAGVGRI